MMCVVCKKGNTGPGIATVTLQRNESAVVFRGVPAEVCANCGEEYVAGDVAARLEEAASQAFLAGVKVDIREYVAA